MSMQMNRDRLNLWGSGNEMLLNKSNPISKTQNTHISISGLLWSMRMSIGDLYSLNVAHTWVTVLNAFRTYTWKRAKPKHYCYASAWTCHWKWAAYFYLSRSGETNRWHECPPLIVLPYSSYVNTDTVHWHFYQNLTLWMYFIVICDQSEWQVEHEKPVAECKHFKKQQ